MKTKLLALSIAMLCPVRAFAAEPDVPELIPQEAAPQPVVAQPVAAPPVVAQPSSAGPVTVGGLRAEASAPATQEAPAPTKLRRRFGVDAELGFRISYLDEAGYQPFSKGSSLGQGSLTVLARYRLDPKKPIELAAGLAYDGGGSSASARGFDTELSTDRFTLVVEPRYFVLPRVYAFGRVGAGPQVTSLRMKNGGPSGNLEQTQVTFALDAGAGVGVHVADLSHDARVSIVADGGYGFAGEQKVRLDASSDDTVGTSGRLELGALAMRGGYWRLAVGGSF